MKMKKHFALPVRARAYGGGVEDATGDTALVAVGTLVSDYDEGAKAAAHAINCHDELVATLEAVRQEIIASALLDQRNAAGLLTDSALWAGRAVDRIDAILNKAKDE